MTKVRRNPSILFASKDKSRVVLDIPLSIAVSQHLVLPELFPQVQFIAPPEQPYPATEPKSEKAKANVLARIDLETRLRNEEYAKFCQEGLEEVRQSYDGPWYMPRVLEQSSPQEDTRGKRRRSPGPREPRTKRSAQLSALILSEQPSSDSWANSDLQGRLVRNDDTTARSFLLERHDGQEPINSPPKSSFYMDDISLESVYDFTSSILKMYPEPSTTAAPGQFDIILIDPPWQNRSATRVNRYSTFASSETEQDNLQPISTIMPTTLSPNGLVAIWVTNKASSRQSALDVFAAAGLSLSIELIWLKIASNGEPTYPLDGLYRQPWEICLIGRAQDESDCGPNKTFLLACPERHSRKPWIGDMLEELHGAASPEGLRKLEVFARCTAAGWCAWGNEPFKFNNKNCWQEAA